MVKTESYRANLLEALKDPETAAEYLSACLDDGDVEVFLLALRDVAEAQGGIRKLSGRAGLNRENLYRMLSGSGNYAKIPLTTFPAIPVKRASSPWNFTVSRLWSMPSTCSIVAWKSGTATACSTAA